MKIFLIIKDIIVLWMNIGKNDNGKEGKKTKKMKK
jgi:hypothetical protein